MRYANIIPTIYGLCSMVFLFSNSGCSTEPSSQPADSVAAGGSVSPENGRHRETRPTEQHALLVGYWHDPNTDEVLHIALYNEESGTLWVEYKANRNRPYEELREEYVPDGSLTVRFVETGRDENLKYSLELKPNGLHCTNPDGTVQVFNRQSAGQVACTESNDSPKPIDFWFAEYVLPNSCCVSARLFQKNGVVYIEYISGAEQSHSESLFRVTNYDNQKWVLRAEWVKGKSYSSDMTSGNAAVETMEAPFGDDRFIRFQFGFGRNDGHFRARTGDLSKPPRNDYPEVLSTSGNAMFTDPQYRDLPWNLISP